MIIVFILLFQHMFEYITNEIQQMSHLFLQQLRFQRGERSLISGDSSSEHFHNFFML